MNDITLLLAGYYSVCNFCKEGKFHLVHEEQTDTSFEEQHVAHGAIEIVPAQKFLSDNLSSQYIDVNRPELKPIGTSLGPVTKTNIVDSFKTSRIMRNKYNQAMSIKKRLMFECLDDDYIPKLQK